MIVLGLTGSIGMGKSTVAAMLEQLGIPVHEADRAVHKLLAEGGKALPALSALFPRSTYPEIYNEDGSVNRRDLGTIIFANDAARVKLEQILHPLVRAAHMDFLQEKRDAGLTMVALDIPLLFETNGEDIVDYTITVTAPSLIQRARVLKRPHMTREKFRAILKRQMPDREKRRRADFVLQTGFGKNHTRRALEKILETIKQKEGLSL